MQGHELVQQHRTMRLTYAVALKAERLRIKNILFNADFDFTIGQVNEIARQNVVRRLGARRHIPFTPTAQNFRRAATNASDFANSHWASRDTEYYSACGYDDYQADRREHAREAAGDYFRAWRYLKG